MTDDWEELCERCSALIKEADMTNDDIDEIVDKAKNNSAIAYVLFQVIDGGGVVKKSIALVLH